MNISIKTEERGFVPSWRDNTLIATADISKDTLVCYGRCPNGQEMRKFKVANNLSGLKEFWAMIVLTQRKYNLSEVIVGFESTGPYSEPLKNFMKDKAVKLVQVNPFHTKRVKELTDNSPGKHKSKSGDTS